MNALYGARASMEPAGWALRYLDEASGEVVSEKRDDFASFSDDVVELGVSFDGEMIEVALIPCSDVRIESLTVELRHAFARDEAVLVNGYQSWTDTVERSPWARMRGLHGVPRAVRERYALAGGGDYAFAEYSNHPGKQHGFTYATFRRGEGMVLVGSLDESGGFTLIRTDAHAGKVTLETEPPVRALPSGQRVVLGRYAITRGTCGQCYDRWFALSGISPRRVRPLVGYTSWYRHYGDIDEEKLASDLAGMEEAFASLEDDVPSMNHAPMNHAPMDHAPMDHAPMDHAPMGVRPRHARRDGNGDASDALPLKLFQIDDGYCKVGDWLELDSAAFPRGLAPLASRAREAGFAAGLWVAPFLCEQDSRVFAEHREWLLRDGEGELVRTGPQWSGGYALDTRNAEVRAYILEVLHTMTQGWGFSLLKADFLYAACMVEHDGLNRGELMADAMALLRAGAGEETLILGCGVPLASAFGVVDYCRIGCDVGLDWDDKPHMRALHRERVSTKNSLGNTYGRAPLDGRTFGNDPDVFFLRDDVALTQSQRDEILFADADSGSVLLTSDDMGKWTGDMRERYVEALGVLLDRKAWR